MIHPRSIPPRIGHGLILPHRLLQQSDNRRTGPLQNYLAHHAKQLAVHELLDGQQNGHCLHSRHETPAGFLPCTGLRAAMLVMTRGMTASAVRLMLASSPSTAAMITSQRHSVPSLGAKLLKVE